MHFTNWPISSLLHFNCPDIMRNHVSISTSHDLWPNLSRVNEQSYIFVRLECISGSLGVSIGSLAQPRSVKIRSVAWHTRLRSRRYDKAWKLRKCSIFFKWTSANDFKLAKWFLIPAASTMYLLQHIHMLKFHISSPKLWNTEIRKFI